MFTLNCKGTLLAINKPIVMGIINVTPDSFYTGSRKQSYEAILQTAEQMINEGATLLDVGAQSTRPGAPEISINEELERILPAIEIIHSNFPSAFISVDTYRAAIAQACIHAGACMVNDISGGSFDSAMLSTVASIKVPYICMHLKGSRQTMHQPVQYENITKDVLDYFIQKITQCRQAGITDIIADVGFGFSKKWRAKFSIAARAFSFKNA